MAKAAGGVATDALRSIVDRIERLSEEKSALTADIGEIYKEAKSFGLDVKALRQLIRERKQDADEREERETLVEIYKRALGMLADTPLGEATLRRVA